MGKWNIIEKMKEAGFSDSELLDMMIYWSDVRLIEECTEEFLRDRDLKFNEQNEIVGV